MIMPDVLSFVVLAVATFRLGSLLAREAGPLDILLRIRHWLGVRYTKENVPVGTNMLSRMALCLYCNTIWIGIILTAVYLLTPVIVFWVCVPFALSGVAVLADQIGE